VCNLDTCGSAARAYDLLGSPMYLAGERKLICAFLTYF